MSEPSKEAQELARKIWRGEFLPASSNTTATLYAHARAIDSFARRARLEEHRSCCQQCYMGIHCEREAQLEKEKG